MDTACGNRCDDDSEDDQDTYMQINTLKQQTLPQSDPQINTWTYVTYTQMSYRLQTIYVKLRTGGKSNILVFTFEFMPAKTI